MKTTALAKCPSCNFTEFENAVKSVQGYNYQLNFIQCARCGSVMGVLPFYDPGVLAHSNHEEIKRLKATLGHLEMLLTQALSR
jgi:uncharacterized Zn finger protein